MVGEVTQWKETLSAINEGRRVTWLHFLSFLRIHRVTADFCTCATYSTLGICNGILLWLLVKEPGFMVPLRYSGKYVGVRPFRYGRVRQTIVSRVEPPHVRELKSQANPSKKGGKKRPKEARHFRDLTTKSYITDCAQTVVYPTRKYLCFKSDSMCDIVEANQEELAVVDLIAEREGVEPQQRKKWSKILDAFGALAFAIAPLHYSFIQQIDGVNCHPACLLTLHCALSWRVVKGILQVLQDRLPLLREMAEAALYFSCSKSSSTPRTPAVHWEVARMYPKPKSLDPVDTCFSCNGAPHIACHKCKVLHCALHPSILCQSQTTCNISTHQDGC